MASLDSFEQETVHIDDLVRLALQHAFSSDGFQQQQLQQQSMDAASSLIRIGMTSSNLTHAVNCLNEANEMLNSCSITSSSHTPILRMSSKEEEANKRLCSLRVQALCRLGQISAIRGEYVKAVRYLHTIVSKFPKCTSSRILALAWYDLALIWSSQGKDEQAQEALQYARSILSDRERQEGYLEHEDEVLLFYVDHAIDHLASTRNVHGTVPLSWSIDFTSSKKSCVQSGLVHTLTNPALRAAGAA